MDLAGIESQIEKARELSRSAKTAFLKKKCCEICSLSGGRVFECDCCFDGYHAECIGENLILGNNSEPWLCKGCRVQESKKDKRPEEAILFPLSILEKLTKASIFKDINFEDPACAGRGKLKLAMVVLLSKIKLYKCEEIIMDGMYSKWKMRNTEEPG